MDRNNLHFTAVAIGSISAAVYIGHLASGTPAIPIDWDDECYANCTGILTEELLDAKADADAAAEAPTSTPSALPTELDITVTIYPDGAGVRYDTNDQEVQTFRPGTFRWLP